MKSQLNYVVPQLFSCPNKLMNSLQIFVASILLKEFDLSDSKFSLHPTKDYSLVASCLGHSIDRTETISLLLVRGLKSPFNTFY